MGKISDTKHNIYVDLPWCLIAGQRSYALVLDVNSKNSKNVYFRKIQQDGLQRLFYLLQTKSTNKLLNCRIGPIGNNYSKFKYNVRSQYRTKVL